MNAILHDLTGDFAARFGGSHTSAGLGLADVRAACSAAYNAHGRNVNATWRADSARFRASVAAARKQDARRVDSAIGSLLDPKLGGSLKDARTDSAGIHSARDLQYVYAEVLRESLTPQSGEAAFHVDTSVPVGAREYKIRRMKTTGEAQRYRGGRVESSVDLMLAEEIQKVHHYVIAFETDFFVGQADNFSPEAISEAAEKLRGAREIMTTKRNDLIWDGDAAAKLYGVTTFPWLPILAPSVAFDGSNTPDEVIACLNAIADFGYHGTNSKKAANALRVSPRIRSYLFQTPRSSTSDTSIGKWFVDNHPRIQSIEEAPELQDHRGDGLDGIFAYKNDRLGVSSVLVQPFTTLAPERRGFQSQTVAYMSVGGATMRDVAANCLAYVKPSPILSVL